MSRLHHAWLNRIDVCLEGSKVSIDSEHLSLKPFLNTFTGVEVEKCFMNFSVNFAKFSSMVSKDRISFSLGSCVLGEHKYTSTTS